MRMLMLVLAVFGALVGSGSAASVTLVAERAAASSSPSPTRPVLVVPPQWTCEGVGDQPGNVAVATAISYEDPMPWQDRRLPDIEVLVALGAAAGALLGVLSGYGFGRAGWILRWQRSVPPQATFGR
ncbi:hypothetical protein AB4305_33505 [Nocardia sp. 2YAB30]|uniref:hypothetical protein n=1 Tax=Nocardia sp. 2YAB30 TaxID=3233022 RepID=UPI003F98FCE2